MESLTKYEIARILARRVHELQNGQRPLVAVDPDSRFLDVAMQELQAKRLPYQIIRQFPGGRTKEISLNPTEPAAKRHRSE
jgi:DNA-directed RNA polymerase subunit K/omega